MPQPVSYSRFFSLALLLLLAYFTWLMLQITLRYIPFSATASFLQIKQTEVEALPYYLPVFYTHVYSSIFILLAGFTQFSATVQRKYKKVHRTVGITYVVLLLLFSAPSGLVMAIHANGGWVAKIFFIPLAVLWWWFTYKAWVTARKHQYKAHREFMIRSFALTLSAITLRLWKVILVTLFQPAPMDVYMIIAGLGWIPNLIIAEYFIIRLMRLKRKINFKHQLQTNAP